jgi:hypothetical protein
MNRQAANAAKTAAKDLPIGRCALAASASPPSMWKSARDGHAVATIAASGMPWPAAPDEPPSQRRQDGRQGSPIGRCALTAFASATSMWKSARDGHAVATIDASAS